MATSATVLFNHAMECFICDRGTVAEQFEAFEKAAAKNHSEAIWILSVIEGVERAPRPLETAFGESDKPLGRFFSGILRFSFGFEEEYEEQVAFWKKGAEAGCSWSQVEYGKVLSWSEMTWFEKSAKQNNPHALHLLGHYGAMKREQEKELEYHRAAAELGWQYSMEILARILQERGDWHESVLFAAPISHHAFFDLLDHAFHQEETEGAKERTCTLNQLRYALGYGGFWYLFENDKLFWLSNEQAKSDCSRCIDYYCGIVESHQKAVRTFLCCWNQLGGGKDVGLIIARMAWEDREAFLTSSSFFGEEEEEEEEEKKILVVWDFDLSLLLEDNTDTFIVKTLAPEIYAEMRKNEAGLQWTDLMDHCMAQLSKAGFSANQIQAAFCRLPFANRELVRTLGALKHVEQIIISDSNVLFIDWILQSHKVEECFAKVYSNPAQISAEDQIRIQHFHQHDCEQKCARNMCKDIILAQYLENRKFSHIFYVGDGRGDFHPCLRTSVTPFARQGYPLQKKLDEAQIEHHVWENSVELTRLFHQLVTNKDANIP
jgi:2,3-diketo-5-methylthio-1-phosphopentane phosphatase